jgi:hypothetical protein
MSSVPRAYQPEYFPLHKDNGEGLLSASQSLVIDPLHDMALLIDWEARQLVSACTFFEEELLLLLPILRAWPGFVPYGRLLALLEAGTPLVEHEREAELTRQYRLAVDSGTHDTLLAPLRAQLAESQQKLGVFGLKLIAVYQEGLVLAQARPKSKAEKGA